MTGTASWPHRNETDRSWLFSSLADLVEYSALFLCPITIHVRRRFIVLSRARDANATRYKFLCKYPRLRGYAHTPSLPCTIPEVVPPAPRISSLCRIFFCRRKTSRTPCRLISPGLYIQFSVQVPRESRLSVPIVCRGIYISAACSNNAPRNRYVLPRFVATKKPIPVGCFSQRDRAITGLISALKEG